MNKIGLDEKFMLFSEYWQPKTIAALNGQEVKLVKVCGESPWHHHEHEDEFFLYGAAASVSNFAIVSLRSRRENASWCRAGLSIAPAPTRKPRFCASSRPARSIPAM